MSRLALLVALSFAVLAPVAQAGSVTRSGPTATIAQSPQPDRDGDGYPDSVDQCPDEPAPNAGWNGCATNPDPDMDGIPNSRDKCPDVAGPNDGCPPADTDGDGVIDGQDRCPTVAAPDPHGDGCPVYADSDNDGVPDKDDACPKVYAKTANGCQPFLWKFFFTTQSLKDFVANKSKNNSWCRGLPDCKTTHVTFTLSAATAKQAGIADRLISSVEIAMSDKAMRKTHGFVSTDISRADQAKLGRLKKVTVTIHAWVVLANGKKVDDEPKTVTMVGKHFVSHVASSDQSNTSL